ncbi:MAG TPA: hypothetical protein VMM78_19830 [Thermomicrobiales bacterium]|nr:hypothetical protein [Thermomicrobiales bacterium]
MSERRVLTDDEAFELLAHFCATADLHTIEAPHYADRRILEGMLPLIDALLRDVDPEGGAWLAAFKADIQQALEVRSRDRQAYEDVLHELPGRIVTEIKRRRAGATR